MGLLKSPRRRKYACSECTSRASSIVDCAAISAWPSTWPPNTCGLPVSRLWPRNRFTSRRSRLNCSSRSTMRVCMRFTPLPSAELERAFHDRVVAGEAAEEGVRLALHELRRRELHRRRLPAADDLRVRDDARVAFLHVVVREAGARA